MENNDSKASGEPSGASLKGKTVLVFEDDQDIQLLIAEFLSRHGVVTTNAIDPREALKSIVVKPPDLIMIDLRMPGFDGSQLLKAIRAINHSIPVIAMSGDYNLLQSSEPLGATQILEKPFTSEDLVKKVKAVLG